VLTREHGVWSRVKSVQVLDGSRKKRNEALWASAKRLSQSNENAFRTPNVTEQVHVFVSNDFSNEFSTMGLQAGKDFFDILNGEHDATHTQSVHRRIRLDAGRRRPLELRQLKSTVAVRRPHHGDVTSDTVEPDDAVHPLPLDGRFALQFKAEFGKERDSGLEVVDNDANVVHLQ